MMALPESFEVSLSLSTTMQTDSSCTRLQQSPPKGADQWARAVLHHALRSCSMAQGTCSCGAPRCEAAEPFCVAYTHLRYRYVRYFEALLAGRRRNAIPGLEASGNGSAEKISRRNRTLQRLFLWNYPYEGSAWHRRHAEVLHFRTYLFLEPLLESSPKSQWRRSSVTSSPTVRLESAPGPKLNAPASGPGAPSDAESPAPSAK